MKPDAYYLGSQILNKTNDIYIPSFLLKIFDKHLCISKSNKFYLFTILKIGFFPFFLSFKLKLRYEN